MSQTIRIPPIELDELNRRLSELIIKLDYDFARLNDRLTSIDNKLADAFSRIERLSQIHLNFVNHKQNGR